MATIGYKMFRKDKSGLHPLYINANEVLPVGVWLLAENGPRTDEGRVKARGGKTLAYRPGWHICPDLPYETHIGKKGESGKIEFFPSDLVWCEVLYQNLVDWQAKADEYKSGLPYIPLGGSYRFKTNTCMSGDWIISGGIKIIREISDEEVKTLCAAYGKTPLPRCSKKF